MIQNKQVAVITGAAKGIGLELAKACLKKAMHVVMTDVDVDSLSKQVDGLSDTFDKQILKMTCDVAHLEEVKALAYEVYNQFGHIDYLFNNAAVTTQLAPVWELEPEHIRRVFDVNMCGVLNGIQAFFPYLLKQPNRAHIINMASMYGLLSGSQVAPYAMSKHAIIALTESLYFDITRLEKPIDLSVVCPSFVNTSLLKNSSIGHDQSANRFLTTMMQYSRAPSEVADYILQEVEKKTFYILPDKEVKNYFESRADAIIKQTSPYVHSIEKMVCSFSKRSPQSN